MQLFYSYMYNLLNDRPVKSCMVLRRTVVGE